jgi:hypothetical protein
MSKAPGGLEIFGTQRSLRSASLKTLKSAIKDWIWRLQVRALKAGKSSVSPEWPGIPQWIPVSHELRVAFDRLDVEQSWGNYVMSVPVDRCIDHVNLSYQSGKWHYFSALLREWRTGLGGASVYEKYIESFQPDSLASVFVDMEDALREPWLALRRFPPLYFSNAMPWSTAKRLKSVGPGMNLCHFGPLTSSQIAIEIRRLQSASDSIERFGYLPELHYDGYVRGFFLLRGSDYRFMVTSGKHRMPAISQKLIPEIDAIIEPNNFMPIVDIDDLKDWPQVRSGLYSEAEAAVLFNNYFDGTKTQARRLERLSIGDVRRQVTESGE